MFTYLFPFSSVDWTRLTGVWMGRVYIGGTMWWQGGVSGTKSWQAELAWLAFLGALSDGELLVPTSCLWLQDW